ncbi:cytochrome b/b6 domain-containing protein [Microbacterium sp. CFBP9023]|uniref:cytochrome b/b6 domain-containing protein n=1 Tax=Microbacterium sp. CFBP9023 TaxID=3096535 RepID=UPI002A6B8C38|nr:cytochrome b/b6 domain-containing protein [Microbacterium sp. CFBP9023]MDY0983351.1 cytochrome b/b6 domain-containing protein [Microbacterium sp. CFBP9023]
MATRMLRRGLPRVPGGEPWPPGDIAVEAPADAEHASPLSAPSTSLDGPEEAAPAAAAPVAAVPETAVPGPESSVVEHAVPSAASGASLRRGLPRTPGGEPWPPASVAAVAGAATARASSSTPEPADAATDAAADVPTRAASPSTLDEPAPESAPVVAQTGSVRRGLPRVAGGDPWPPADTVPLIAVTSDAAPSITVDAPDAAPEVAASAPASAPAAAPASAPTTAVATAAAFALGDPSIPLPAPRTVWNGSAPRHVTATAPASDRPRPTWTQAIAVLLGAAALGILAAAAVAFVRALLSFPFMQDFLAAFPGEYEPAVAVEPGFVPWTNWAHFFNVFLMVLIIRSGLRIRNEKRPTAFWTPRNDPKGKVSLTIWFHQALDILWLVNGVIFVVLLFVTGHWARIVPTSWEVIPNALSAALQYVSFDWPTEHGWVNYNSLQQLAYFVTVFIAAPLAAATGFRMSGMWPKKAERLSKAYPIEWARALHFPIMIYFVVFIIGHVALVFLTGFLRNLNHMYASSDAVGWTGFWVFVASLVVIALGWVAARPLVIAPIAKLFGTVSGR